MELNGPCAGRRCAPIIVAMSRFDPAGNPRSLLPPHSLVVFVGMGARPAAELTDGLARDGVRGLWLDRVEQALTAAAHAHFDAAVVRLDERAWRWPLWRLVVDRWDVRLLVAEIGMRSTDHRARAQCRHRAAPARVAAATRAHLMRLLRRTAADAHGLHRARTCRATTGGRLDGSTGVHNRLLREDRQVALTSTRRH
jgi:hypothetical protein